MRKLFLVLFILINAALGPSAFAQSITLKGNELVLAHPVTFKEGTATLTDAGKLALTDVKTYLDEKSYISTLRIEGHVFGNSNAEQLSEGRAMSVAKQLIKSGVDCKRLIVVGFGDTKPVTEHGDNSRIVFVNAALRGHAIGGMPLDGGGKVALEACSIKITEQK